MYSPYSEPNNRATVLRFYDECFNQGTLDFVDQVISPQFTVSGIAEAGPAAFKANVYRLRTAFPDIHFTVHDLVAENDRVAVYWTWEGTHRGSFANIPPTGNRVRQEGMVLYRFDAGKVTEFKPVFDRLGVLQQLGATR